MIPHPVNGCASRVRAHNAVEVGLVGRGDLVCFPAIIRCISELWRGPVKITPRQNMSRFTGLPEDSSATKLAIFSSFLTNTLAFIMVKIINLPVLSQQSRLSSKVLRFLKIEFRRTDKIRLRMPKISFGTAEYRGLAQDKHVPSIGQN